MGGWVGGWVGGRDVPKEEGLQPVVESTDAHSGYHLIPYSEEAACVVGGKVGGWMRE